MEKMQRERINEGSNVTVVLTSCGRPDLLKKTIDSFFQNNTYPVKKFIIVEDSGNPSQFDFLKEYPVEVIYNPENIGQIKSIVKAYAIVDTEYIFHCEDDWQFYRPGFMEQSMKVLESDPKILQVWIRGIQDTNSHPVEPGFKFAQSGIKYKLLKLNYLGKWHGFSFNPGLKRMKNYVPYDTITSYEGKGNSGAEQEIGEYYYKNGFRGAIIMGVGFVKHIGWANTTRQRAMIWNLDDAKNQHQYSPRLAAAFSYLLPKAKPVIDLGCGKGSYLKTLFHKGFICFGYEGTPGINEIADFDNITQCDLTTPMVLSASGSSLCLEVAEHIPKEHEATLLQNITECCDEWLIISWAVKGQGGFGHVNEQNSDYVIKTISDLGFEHIQGLSDYLRTEGGADLWWFKKSIYVFKKC